MDKGVLSLWLQLIIAAVIFETGQCIKCYHCSSRHDPLCADPASRELRTIECREDIVSNTNDYLMQVLSRVPDTYNPYNRFSCVKVNAKSPYEDHKHTIRGCFYTGTGKHDGCPDLYSKVIEGLQFCETCYDDGCNGTSKNQHSVFWSMLSTCLALMIGARL